MIHAKTLRNLLTVTRCISLLPAFLYFKIDDFYEIKWQTLINFGIIKIIVQWCNGSFHQMSCKIGALENFAKLTGKHLCRSLLFNKVAGLNHLCYRTPPRNCFRRFIYFRDHYGRTSRCCLSIPAENIRKPLWLIMMGGPFY